MKSLMVHYKNKYHDGEVRMSESSLDAYDSSGRHCVALRKNGAGQFVDQSKELGCEHEHDLSPIPKDARLYKQCPKSGHVIKDEKHDERKKVASKFIVDGRVESCEKLSEKFKFDDKQKIVEEK